MGEERCGRTALRDIRHPSSVARADLQAAILNVFASSKTSVDKKTEPGSGGLWGLREVCRDACRSEDSGKHAPNPSRGLTLLTPPLF